MIGHMNLCVQLRNYVFECKTTSPRLWCLIMCKSAYMHVIVHEFLDGWTYLCMYAWMYVWISLVLMYVALIWNECMLHWFCVHV